MRFAGKGLRGMITGTVVGTFATWVAVTAFAPECSMFKPVEFVTLKPTPPEVEKYIDKAVKPYVSIGYEYPESYVVKSVKPAIEYAIIYAVEQYIEKSVKPSVSCVTYDLFVIKIGIDVSVGVSNVTSNISAGMEVARPQNTTANISVGVGVEITIG
jgi:hypothetical protein